MLDNDSFDRWLDHNAAKVMDKIMSGQALNNGEIIVFLPKAQTNYIAYLGQGLRDEMLALRKDMDERFEQLTCSGLD